MTNATAPMLSTGLKSVEPDVHHTVEFARCFLRLANLPNFALDRLSRYEATLWRQVRQTLFALDALDRRKPQERGRRFPIGRRSVLPSFERDGSYEALRDESGQLITRAHRRGNWVCFAKPPSLSFRHARDRSMRDPAKGLAARLTCPMHPVKQSEGDQLCRPSIPFATW